MADVQKDIVLKVKAESEQATGQFKNLKQELRSIEGELNKMATSGDTGSEAFKKLQQRAGQVKDQINDTKGAIKALSSDTFKLDAFAQGAQGIAGGFAAAQGAMALFGSENKAVEEAIKKTQGAMALLQGVTAITNVLQKESAFSQLFLNKAQKEGAVATDAGTKATKGFSKALIATGVGALVAALGFLIANFEDVKKVVNNLLKPFDGIIAKVRDFLHTISFGLIDDASTAKTKENAEESLKAIEKVANYNKSMEKQLQRNIDLAKAKGKSDKEILKLEKELLDFRLKNNYAEQDAIKNKMALGTATDDEKKKLFELVESARDLVKDRELLDINYQNGVKKRNEEAQKEKEKNDELAQKEREKNAKEQRDFEDSEREKSNEADRVYFEGVIASETIAKDKKLEIAKDLYLQGVINEKEYNDTINKLNEEEKKLEEEERLKSLEADKVYFDGVIESERIKLQQKLDLAKEYYEKGIISETEYNETVKKLNDESFNKRMQTFNEWAQVAMDGLNALSQLNEAFSKKDGESQRKAFERDKKFKLANAIISTSQAVMGQLAVIKDQPTGINFIKAGIVLATGLAQIKKISSTTFQGGGSPSSSIGGGGGSVPAPSQMATTTPTIGSTQLQLDAQGNLQQGSMRTYVLETDISDKQKRSQRLQRTATLGK
jgi:uncharacterized membrane protein